MCSVQSVVTYALDDLATPAFIIEHSRMAANCRAMLQRTQRSKVRFRPHVKTHKTLEGARLQHGGATGPITVSTLAEAEFFAARGFSDITYGVAISPQKLSRVHALNAAGHQVGLILDHPAALDAVEAYGQEHRCSFAVWLDVDTGYHRTGIDPTSRESVALALRLHRSKSIAFKGVFSHAGHSYDCVGREAIRRVAAAEDALLADFVQRLMREGVAPSVRSVGSTPTCSAVETLTGCEEVRPGNYIFYDLFQTTIGACSTNHIAASILATVIGIKPPHLVLDAGALALSKDRGAVHADHAAGFGVVTDLALNLLNLRITHVWQEHSHATLQSSDKTTVQHDSFYIGQKVRILPNHACLAAALFDCYYVVSNQEVIDMWRPVRGF